MGLDDSEATGNKRKRVLRQFDAATSTGEFWRNDNRSRGGGCTRPHLRHITARRSCRGVAQRTSDPQRKRATFQRPLVLQLRFSDDAAARHGRAIAAPCGLQKQATAAHHALRRSRSPAMPATDWGRAGSPRAIPGQIRRRRHCRAGGPGIGAKRRSAEGRSASLSTGLEKFGKYPLGNRRGLCYTPLRRRTRPALFLGSSVVEQPAVNRLVAGSNPARGATRLIRRCLPAAASNRKPHKIQRKPKLWPPPEADRPRPPGALFPGQVFPGQVFSSQV